MAITSTSQYSQPQSIFSKLPPEVTAYILETAIKSDGRLAVIIPCVCKLWADHTKYNLFPAGMAATLELTSAFHLEGYTSACGWLCSVVFAAKRGQLRYALAALNHAEDAITGYQNPVLKKVVIEKIQELRDKLPDNLIPLKQNLFSPSTDKENDPPTPCCPINVRAERKKALLAKAPPHALVPSDAKRLRF